MPRTITDEGQRRLSISFTLRQIIREMVMAEADRLNVPFGRMLETLLVESLTKRGYPTDEVEEEHNDDTLKEEVLSTYRKFGTITETARRCSLSLSTIYRWVAEDEDFKARYNLIKAGKHGSGNAHRSTFDIPTPSLRETGRRNGRRPITELPARGEEL